MLKAYVAAKTRLMNIQDKFAELRKDDSGAALIEYALVVGLMAVVAVAAVGSVSTPVKGAFTYMATQLGNVK